MIILAHRGAAAYAPENTLPSFAKAVELGADGIELDVHLSSDGVLMVAHDESIDRCSNGTGLIRSMTCEELKSYDYSYRFPEYRGVTMPTLEEVFQLIQPTNLCINVELKTNKYPYPGIEEQCLAMAEKYGLTDRILYSSFSRKSLHRMHELNPDLPLALLYGRKRFMGGRDADRQPWEALHPEYYVLYLPGEMERYRRMGKRVHVWTVDSPEEVRKLAALGVDGIITNAPDVVRRTLEEIK